MRIKVPGIQETRAFKSMTPAEFAADIARHIRERVNSLGQRIDGVAVEAYGKRTWIATFASFDDTLSCHGMILPLYGKNPQLVPFEANLSQVYICKAIPDQVDLDAAVHRILAALPTHRIHVSVGGHSKKHKSLCLLLEEPDGIEKLTLRLPRTTTTGFDWPVTFEPRFGVSGCTVCQKSGHHATPVICQQMTPIVPRGRWPEKLLAHAPLLRHRRPPVDVAY